jgi:hypothetical protein
VPRPFAANEGSVVRVTGTSPWLRRLVVIS